MPESLYPFTYNPKMSLNLSQVPCSSPPSMRTQHKDTTEAAVDKVGSNGSFHFLLLQLFLQVYDLVKALYIFFVTSKKCSLMPGCLFNNLFNCLSISVNMYPHKKLPYVVQVMEVKIRKRCRMLRIEIVIISFQLSLYYRDCLQAHRIQSLFLMCMFYHLF